MACGVPGAIPLKPRDARLVQTDPEPGACRNLQAELAVVERFGQNLFSKEKRTKELGSPFEMRKGREQMGSSHRANGAFEHRAAVNADACRIGDSSNTAGGKQAARLRDLDRENACSGMCSQIEGSLWTVQCLVGHDRHP